MVHRSVGWSVRGAAVRRVIDGLSTGYRRVMLATYLRVNHWADFDESYSDGKLSAAATPSNNAGPSSKRSANWSRVKESKTGLTQGRLDFLAGLDLVQLLVLYYRVGYSILE